MTYVKNFTELRLHEGSFRAFGSNCRIVTDVESGVQHGVSRLEDLESRWSRFIATSEVSQLNAAEGDWYSVSAITIELATRAELARRKTGGRFNPLMAGQLAALGYNRSFEQLGEAHDHSPIDVEPATSGGIEVSGSDIRVPVGSCFDPGGLGKGLAADLVVSDLVDAGATWAVVSLGGDVRFGGSALCETTQSVWVDDPRTDNAILGVTRVAGGALATSSTTGKQWKRGNRRHHHLLDPATGRPVSIDGDSSRIAASVYANSAWWADVVAKVIVVDPSIGSATINSWDCEAIAFTSTDVIDLGLPVQQVDTP